MEMATTFANHASTALELAEARRDQQRVLLLEDRARIARDLHDHVIQQVFAAGLMVQATASATSTERRRRAAGGRGALDEAIKQIRVSIFQLQPPSPAACGPRSWTWWPRCGRPSASTCRARSRRAARLRRTDDLVRDVTAVVREG